MSSRRYSRAKSSWPGREGRLDHMLPTYKALSALQTTQRFPATRANIAPCGSHFADQALAHTLRAALQGFDLDRLQNARVNAVGLTAGWKLCAKTRLLTCPVRREENRQSGPEMPRVEGHLSPHRSSPSPQRHQRHTRWIASRLPEDTSSQWTEQLGRGRL